ncbi:MAG TPA: molecular chaperone TorD family protein [Dehalococcoidia bacterium]|jgi:nitrate reductase delta subunit|nr:hypothetical protein [Chloroflexota bacterium]MDP5876360.1 molecular chaperone TorD family protein [Dehalococcoidia bacterium]MDP7161476.1 molecular chaperone TorD family protein [Dehalococcoidia bacterium]MDP7212540.1 molecular chaperone TorD family protein [Dehalococcoidia bacterium]MDP7514305.1 molecular chaperone TorD family protein [Dehalococcoidia bacterium]|tara:strand:- start:1279 stop:1881 length:603 start_codon:yes stop_codon:yes gene_type:complete
MPDRAVRDRLLGLFGGILDYPGENTLEQLRLAEECVAADFPDAVDLLGDFRAVVADMPAERREEVYTAIFDLNATCHPYVGYQLFGETYKRSSFLVECKEQYREFGFVAPEPELPDRLSIMLHFVSECGDAEVADDIIEYGFIPALAKMTKTKEPSIKDAVQSEENPYSSVLRALQVVLGQEPQPEEPIIDHAGDTADVR